MKRSLPLHIWWHGDRTFDLQDEYDVRRYYEVVLREGTAADVRELSHEQIRSLLPSLWLPPEIRLLWEDYFAWCDENGYQPKP